MNSITTYGEIMDWANATDNQQAKDFLRKAFQGWASANNRPLFDARTVMDWRNTRIKIGLDEKALEAIRPMLEVASNA